MGDPVQFIRIGGVRYDAKSVVEHTETVDENGNKKFNVTLDGGTKLSYPEQPANSGVGYTVKFFDRNALGDYQRISKGGDASPLVLAHAPINNNRDVSISIFGLKNATIQGSSSIREDIEFANCSDNQVYLNHGDKENSEFQDNDAVDITTWDKRKFGKNSNNNVYMDYYDRLYDVGDNNLKNGNKIIRDEKE